MAEVGNTTQKGSMMPIIIGLVVLLVLAGAYYYYSSSQAAAAAQAASVPPPPPPPPPPMVAAAPAAATGNLATLYSTGQKIQDTEIEIGTSSVPFASAPFGYDLTAPPNYTMTVDIMVAQTGDRWRNILEHGPSTGNDFPPGATFRRPSVFITGSDTAPPNRLMVTHANSSGENTNITTTSTAPLGKYFTLTWVVTNGTMTVYFNGQPDPAGPVSANFNWPQTDTPWTWNQGNYLNNIAGSIKIKNAYYWPRAIASSDMAQIAAQYSSSTSHYTLEPMPFTKD